MAEQILYTAQPSEDGIHWYVWDMYGGLPPKPVFISDDMIEAQQVAEALNG